MESIYVENYVKIPVQEKLQFLKSLSKNNEFEVSNQEVVFAEESIIFEIKNKSDVNKAYINFKNFFKKFKEVKVDKITKMKNKANQITLHFNDSKNHIRI